jgi:hypothetical protein
LRVTAFDRAIDLSAHSILFVEQDHRQPCLRSLSGSGKSGRSGTDHGNID